MRYHSRMDPTQHKYQRESRSIALLIFCRTNPSISLCRQLIRKLLTKDELRRLGSRAGASDIKAHPFFRSTQWALLRHAKPPIVPHQGRSGIDTVNFRNVKESHSVDIGTNKNGNTLKVKAVPLDSGLRTPGDEDPFEDFNSVTLHHDGDEGGFIVYESAAPGWENEVGRAR